MFARLSSNRLLPRCRRISKVLHVDGIHSFSTSHYIFPVLSLREYCPCDALENYVHSMHDNFGFPYIFAICTIPLLTKYLIRLPLDVLSTKLYEERAASIPEINESKFESLLTILQKKKNSDAATISNYIYQSMKQFEFKFITSFPSIIAFYAHLTAYISIERMIFHDSNTNILLFFDQHSYLSTTETPYMMLPIVNGFGMMFCYAFMNQHKSAHYAARRRNVYLSLIFIPVSALFFSSAFHFYFLSNLIGIAFYQKSTTHNEAFQSIMGLMNNESKYHLSNMAKLSTLYIEYNKSNFKSDSISVFTKSFQSSDLAPLSEDIDAVLTDDRIFVPTLPPKHCFRNIEDEIDYFDDEYDEFVQRIEDKHHERYLETHRKQIYLDQRDTLFLPQDTDNEMQSDKKLTQ